MVVSECHSAPTMYLSPGRRAVDVDDLGIGLRALEVRVHGLVNADPYSFFNIFGNTPPIIVLGLNPRREKTLKDTTANIHATREFVVNLVDGGRWPTR